MAVSDAPTVADTQRNRAFRKEQAGAVRGSVEPPRQRRSGMAALAVVLIAGGALLAGLLAVRMDAREPVLVAARDIAPGAQITGADLREVNVSSEGLALIPAEQRFEILDGSVFARQPIKAGSLLDRNVLTRESPLAGDRAIVSVPIDPSLAPISEMRAGDLVQVVRTAAKSGRETAVLTEAIVLSRGGGMSSGSSSDAQVTQRASSVNLLVPREIASEIVDAASNGAVGLTLIERGRTVGSSAGTGPEDSQ